MRQFLDIGAIGASCLAFYFVARMKPTYFLDSRAFMGIANGAFVILLVQAFVSDLTITAYPQWSYVSLVFLMALSVGFAGFRLASTRAEGSGWGGLRRFLVRPPRNFVLFVAVALGWYVSGILLQPWTSHEVQTVDGVAYFYLYDTWFLVYSGLFLAAFILCPVATAYRLTGRIEDPKASRSVRVISLSWASFGAVLLFQQISTGAAAPLEQSIAALVNSLLFVLISFATKEPTVLSRIMSNENNQHNPARPIVPRVTEGLLVGNPGLAVQVDGFASLLRLRHHELEHKRFLVEYDPETGYERLVERFVLEFLAEAEPVAVFTSVGSPVHRLLHGRPDVKLFSFSTKTSTPLRQSENEILLPERDASLLLDAIDKLFQAHNTGRIGVVFDVFTDLILFKGFDKTYGVISSVSEMVDSQPASTLVLINGSALGSQPLGGLRGLFSLQLVSDSEGLHFVRTRGEAPSMSGGLPEPAPGEENPALGGVKG